MKNTIFTNSNSIHGRNLLLKGTMLFLIGICLIFSSCEGPEGPIGPAGPTGAQGTAGAQGAAGTNGTNGTSGQNYTSKLFDFEASLNLPTEFSTGVSDAGPFVVADIHFNSDVVEYNDNLVQTGDILDGQVSKLILSSRTYPAQTLVSFVASIDCEDGFDYLLWLVDGQIVNGISGLGGPLTYQFFVPAGTHTIEWRYTKDATITVGADAARIDNILIEKWVAGRLTASPELPETMSYWNDRPANLSK